MSHITSGPTGPRKGHRCASTPPGDLDAAGPTGDPMYVHRVPTTATTPLVRILVVDDDRQVLDALGRLLRARGHEVVTVESGEGAVALAREVDFDLALCDRNMPGMCGIDLMEALRDIQPMCARVLLTGELDLSSTLNAINRGSINGVLEKPVGAKALDEAVAEALEARNRMLAAYDQLQRRHDSGERRTLTEMLDGGLIKLALQPIVHASDHRVFGYEALLRTDHPIFGEPLSVLGAVERQHMVSHLADAVADRALECLRTTPRASAMFINVHPAELAEPHALERRLDLLQKYVDRIVFEITEHSSVMSVTSWGESIAMIRERGYNIAVDDLGAGYSALSMLAELKPQYIKVDMSIIRSIDRAPHKQRLMDLLSRFADATDALLIAEGIETKEEAAIVEQCGAHLMQGFLFGRPQILSPLRVIDGARAVG